MSVGASHLYVIGGDGLPYVKIGTSTDPQRRIRQLQTGLPFTLSVLWSCEMDQYLERDLHEVFSDFRVRGEWFDLTSFGDPVEAVQRAVQTARLKDLDVRPVEYSDHPWGARICESIRCVWCAGP